MADHLKMHNFDQAQALVLRLEEAVVARAPR